MFGFLNINKPPRMTSRDVVNVVQRFVRPEKIGHAGTLDPLATGVLVIGIGQATRLFPYLARYSKSYRATFQFGLRSETDDIDGHVEEVGGAEIDRERLEQELTRWRGEVHQVPPIYSAAKVGGRRAYELARGGHAPELAARTVTILHLELVSYHYPNLQLAVECSSGTYIRSLGRDIAAALGTSAVMTELERTAVGPFTIADAVALDEIQPDNLERLLLSPTCALGGLPRVALSAEQLRDVLHGRMIDLVGVADEFSELAAVDDQGALMAILARVNPTQWRPERCFASPAQQGK